jgi:hypothetical protein
MRKRFQLFLVLIVIPFAAGCGSPDLTRSEAGQIIARTPEFNATRKLINVKSTTRGADSLDYCCYTAEFIFEFTVPVPSTRISVGTSVDAVGEFRYWDGKWHLQSFDYKAPVWGEQVLIRSVLPKEQQAQSKKE